MTQSSRICGSRASPCWSKILWPSSWACPGESPLGPPATRHGAAAYVVDASTLVVECGYVENWANLRANRRAYTYTCPHCFSSCLIFFYALFWLNSRLELDRETAAFMLLRHAIDNVFHLCQSVDLREQSVCHKRMQTSNKSKAKHTHNWQLNWIITSTLRSHAWN